MNSAIQIEALNALVAAQTGSHDDRIHRLLELGCRTLRLPQGFLLSLGGATCLVTPGADPRPNPWPDFRPHPSHGQVLACYPRDAQPPGDAAWQAWLASLCQTPTPGDIPPPGGLAYRLAAPLGEAETGTGKDKPPCCVLCFIGPQDIRDSFDDSDRRFLQMLAQWIAVDMERRSQRHSLVSLMSWQQAMLEGANVTIIATDPQGTIITFNRAAETMLGYRAEEMVGKSTPAILHDAEEVSARARELSQELHREIAPGFEVFVAKASLGIPEEREWTYLRRDGSRFPVLLSVTALRDGNDQINGYLGIGLDITLRKQLEATTAEARANELSRALIRALGEAVIGVGLQAPHTIHFLNPEAERLFGCREREAIGRPLESIVRAIAPLQPVDNADRLLKERREGLSSLFSRQPGRENVETTVVALATGDTFPVDCIASPLSLAGSDPGESLDMAVIAFHDLTERRQAEQRLRLSDRVFEYSAEAIMVTDAAGIILNVNPAFSWLTGFRPDEVIGQTPPHPRLRPPRQGLLRRHVEMPVAGGPLVRGNLGPAQGWQHLPQMGHHQRGAGRGHHHPLRGPVLRHL